METVADTDSCGFDVRCLLAACRRTMTRGRDGPCAAGRVVANGLRNSGDSDFGRQIIGDEAASAIVSLQSAFKTEFGRLSKS